MTQTERKIAHIIWANYHEAEHCFGSYYRVYVDATFDGALRDFSLIEGKQTDILCIEYVVPELGRSFVQMLTSCPPDDMYQEWISWCKLSVRDRRKVAKLFDAMSAKMNFRRN